MVTSLTQYNDTALLILRLAMGVIFLFHAMPKLKNSSGMGKMVGMPSSMVLMLGIVEFLSGLGMVLGIYIQIAALLLAVVMVGAIYMKAVKWHIPFAAMDKTGWEFDLILLAVAIFILVNGGGAIVI